MTPCGPTQEKSGRYVEAFLYSDRPGKLRFKKGSSAVEKGVQQDNLEMTALAMPEQAMKEIRSHMAQIGHHELLLSMLGVALSPSTRLYLRKGGSGVKQLLAQYPDEFAIIGEKGREKIVRSSVISVQNGPSPTSGCIKVSEPQASPTPIRHDTIPNSVFNSPVTSPPEAMFASPKSAIFQPPINSAQLSPDSNGTLNSFDSPFESLSLNWTQQSQCSKSMSTPGFDTPTTRGPGSTSVASLCLSGLPPDASEQDILIFFAQHGVVECVADEARVVEIVSKTTSFLPGHAMVKMASHKDAEVACRALDMQCFGGRFLKVALSYLGDTGGSGGASAVVEPEPQLHDPSWQQLLRMIEDNTAVF